MPLFGCGGDSDDSSDGSTRDRVSFTGSEIRTVFPDGTISFTVSPALSSTEQAVCSLNGAAASPCMTGPGTGEIQFAGLAPGAYQLRVEIRAVDGTTGTPYTSTLRVVTPDVVVYAATPGGITSAVAAARAGQTAVILEPTRWVGGVMSGGLAKTDIGWRGHEIFGGLVLEFFHRIREAEGARGACPGSCDVLYDFEPQVAERVFEEMLDDAGVIVERSARLLDVKMDGPRIVSIETTRGTVSGQIFIDASYEGDLMAHAGVPYRVGREARRMANPPDDPVQLAEQEDNAGTHRYRAPRGLRIDPYWVPGDPSSGVLPYIEPLPSPMPKEGDPDSRVMAYTYRLCVTDDPNNQIPFEAPEGYDPAQYEAMGRLAETWAQTGVDLAVVMFNPALTVRSRDPAYFKYDLNGGSTFSIDMTAPDMNQAYVEADEETRERIRKAYQQYIRGLLYFWKTDPRLGGLNQKIARFGYCKDEFTDRGNWPHQLYVRAARRMEGEFMMNENDIMQNGRRPPVPEPVGYGAYNIDVHTVRYHVAPLNWSDGSRRDAIAVEGYFVLRQPNDEPYPVSYRVMTPRPQDAVNLLNPVTISATHIAYSALRMEPTFMMLGEAAGTAAAIAIEQGVNVQDVPYAELRRRLIDAGQRVPPN